MNLNRRELKFQIPLSMVEPMCVSGRRIQRF